VIEGSEFNIWSNPWLECEYSTVLLFPNALYSDPLIKYLSLPSLSIGSLLVDTDAVLHLKQSKTYFILTEQTLLSIRNKAKQYFINWTDVVLRLKQSRTILYWLNRCCSPFEIKQNIYYRLNRHCSPSETKQNIQYRLNRHCSPSETKQNNTSLTEQTLFSIWNKAKHTSMTEQTLFYIWNKAKHTSLTEQTLFSIWNKAIPANPPVLCGSLPHKRRNSRNLPLAGLIPREYRISRIRIF
jgi:hypothetical protein